MKKIAIIGCSGSGKTTLSLKIKDLLDLPIYHLDKYYWKPNWKQPDFKDFEDIHSQICSEDKWIVEGMYTRSIVSRFYKADAIIFLDLPIYKCLFRVLKRIIKNYGKTTLSSAPDCPERLDLGFLNWVLNFKNQSRPHITSALKLFDDNKKIYIVNSQNDINKLIRELRTNLVTTSY